MTLQDAPITVIPDEEVPAPDTMAPAQRRGLATRLRTIGPPLVVLVAAVGCWYIYSWWIGEAERNISMPYAHDVLDVAFLNGENFRELMSATWVSAKVAASWGSSFPSFLGIFFAVRDEPGEAGLSAPSTRTQCFSRPSRCLALVPVIGSAARIRLQRQGFRCRSDLAVPHHHEHLVRAEVRRARPP